MKAAADIAFVNETVPDAEPAGPARDFKRAWESHDFQALVGPLDPDATAVADGGGRARAEVTRAREELLGPIRALQDIAGDELALAEETVVLVRAAAAQQRRRGPPVLERALPSRARGPPS